MYVLERPQTDPKSHRQIAAVSVTASGLQWAASSWCGGRILICPRVVRLERVAEPRLLHDIAPDRVAAEEPWRLARHSRSGTTLQRAPCPPRSPTQRCRARNSRSHRLRPCQAETARQLRGAARLRLDGVTAGPITTQGARIYTPAGMLTPMSAQMFAPPPGRRETQASASTRQLRFKSMVGLTPRQIL